MSKSIVHRAIGAAGGGKALADALEPRCRPQAIYQWVRIPANRVLQVSRITGIPKEELRPDLYPPEDNAA